MKVGYISVWQNLGNAIPDGDLFKNELHLAEQLEGLGFDALWTVEHHFADYSMCPDPLTYLSYMAGRTTRLELGAGVVVLPWHDPVRVAEQVVMLDHLSNGRFRLGVGRGLGRIEYEGYRVRMDEARERFDESAEIVIKALESGKVEYDGTYFKIPERTLRPEPRGSFAGRTWAAAVSPESVQSVARLGLPLLFFVQKPYPTIQADLDAYRSAFVEINGREPAPNVCALFVYCHEDSEEAHERAADYMGNYWTSTMAHYELHSGSHHATTKGYESYSAYGKALDRSGTDAARQGYVDLQAHGTPDEVFEKVRWVRENINCETLLCFLNYGGMDITDAERNMKLFASEVMPRLQALPALVTG